MNPSETNQSKEVAWGGIANLLQMGVGFLGLAFVTNNLDQSIVGSYFYLLSVVKISDGPLSGLVDGAKKRFSEENSQQGEILGMVIILVCISIGLFAGVAIILETFQIIYHASIAVILFAGFITSKMFLDLSTATGKVALKSGIELLRTIFRTGMWVAVSIVGLGLSGLVLSNLIASILVVPIAFVIIDSVPVIPSRRTIGSVWDFGKWSIGNDMMYKITDQITPFLLGFWVATEAVASYEVSMRLLIPGLLFTSIIGPSAMSRISDLDSRDISTKNEIQKVLSFSSLLTIPIFFGSLVIGGDLIRALFGQSYSGLGLIVSGLALSVLIKSQTSVMGSVLRGLDRVKDVFRMQVITFFMGVPSLSTAIWLGGLEGAVVGLIIWNFLKLGGALFYLKDLITTYVYKKIGAQVLCGILMMSVVIVVDQTMDTRLLKLPISLIVGGVVYFGSVLYLDGELRSIFYENLRNRSVPL